jgi:hypothetical protein
MKKIYSVPRLAVFGSVEDLTKGIGFGGGELLVFSHDLI